MKYQRDSIERALALHQRESRIGEWSRRRDNPGHHIWLNNFGPLMTSSLRESFLVVCGMASAAKAPVTCNRFHEDESG